jgi:hypothetical protein
MIPTLDEIVKISGIHPSRVSMFIYLDQEFMALQMINQIGI